MVPLGCDSLGFPGLKVRVVVFPTQVAYVSSREAAAAAALLVACAALAFFQALARVQARRRRGGV